GGSAVGRFHNAGAAAAANDETPGVIGDAVRPFGQAPGQFAGIAIVVPHGAFFGDARRPEEHDRIPDLFTAEMIQGLEIFRQKPQRAGRRAVDKRVVLISNQAVVRFFHGFSNCSIFFLSSRTVFNNSGSLGKAVMARSQMLAAKAGEPETREPAGTS